MSTLIEELTAIKAVEDKLTANKVANFAYTDHAYNNPLTEADGVETYDVDNEQNIPVANASILKVNTTILTKGWRAQASAITRMLMNHFLGRTSYNLNKINDLFSLFLTKLMAYIGQPNGLATLDANGKVTGLDNVVNTGDTATPTEDSTDKFTAGGAYTLQQAVNGKAPTNHASASTTYGVASSDNYGHVRLSGKLRLLDTAVSSSINTLFIANNVIVARNYTGSSASFTVTKSGIIHGSSTYYYTLLKNGASPEIGSFTLTTSASQTTDSKVFTVPANSVLIIHGWNEYDFSFVQDS